MRITIRIENFNMDTGNVRLSLFTSTKQPRAIGYADSENAYFYSGTLQIDRQSLEEFIESFNRDTLTRIIVDRADLPSETKRAVPAALAQRFSQTFGGELAFADEACTGCESNVGHMNSQSVWACMVCGTLNEVKAE